MAKAIPNPEPRRNSGEPGQPGPVAELEQLRAENRELRSIVGELQHLAEAGDNQGKHDWPARQAEYESLLEEKSEIIRSLHLKLHELQEKAAVPPLPNEEELREMSEDVERERILVQKERRELEELRRQLVDDEQSMTQQMREMEVQMARERAELARQRSELQRIQDEINLELERVARDSGLSERLGQLRQRYQEATMRKGAAPNSQPAGASPAGPAPQKDEAETKKDSSLFRRLFG